MTTAADMTLRQALDIARRLSARDRAQLIAVLAQELVEPASHPVNDGWSRWAALRADIARHYPDAQLGERLDADRRERDKQLSGSAEE
jgi:hypothetical protein